MKKYAVFGIPDNDLAKVVRRYQECLLAITDNSLAFRFPVHITLRGPFWANPSPAQSLIAQARLLTAQHIPKGVEIALNGPFFIEPSLCWFELKSGNRGFSELSRLHAAAEEMVSPIVLRDDVRSGHRGTGYRPHITLNWNATASTCSEDPVKQCGKQLNGRIENVAIAVYSDNWPDSGGVDVLGMSQ